MRKSISLQEDQARSGLMDGGSSPLATVEDIQRRLLRPISIISSPYGVAGTTLKENSTSRRDSTPKRKLDDYLDPVLLSAICARIRTGKKEAPKKEIEDLDFRWSDDDLKALMEDPSKDEWRSKEVIDLNEDAETTVNDDAQFCTPFRRLDESALKRLKR